MMKEFRTGTSPSEPARQVPLASKLRERAKWECWGWSDADDDDDDDEWEAYNPKLWQ